MFNDYYELLSELYYTAALYYVTVYQNKKGKSLFFLSLEMYNKIKTQDQKQKSIVIANRYYKFFDLVYKTSCHCPM